MSDLISRQEVIIALRESGLCYNNWLEVLGVIDAVPIESLPSAEGEWIDVNGDGSLWRCNKCKDTACCDGNFCPNCGARMKGGDEK